MTASALKSFTVREGHVTLRVWPAAGRVRGKVYPAWEFEYVDPEHGRRRIKRARRSDAEAKAREVAQRLARGEFTVKGRQAADYSEAEQVATQWGVTVAHMARHYHAARLAEREHAVPAKSNAEIIAEFLAWQKEENSAVHVADLTQRLNRFQMQVKCPLRELTADTLQSWLEGLQVARRTKRNYRGVIANLIAWAKARGYVPKTFDILSQIPVTSKRGQQRDMREAIFTPLEMRLLLAHIRRSALPALLIGGFAGARISEIRKLNWSDILWDENLIAIPVGTKTGRRLAPMVPNLRVWLEPLKDEGRVVKLSRAGINDAFADAVKKANAALAAEQSKDRVRWRQNAPRHSFVSYRCADTRNLALVADECGHSVRVLQTVYREIVSPRAAKDWFSITPAEAGNVIQLSQINRQTSPKSPTTAEPIAKNV